MMSSGLAWSGSYNTNTAQNILSQIIIQSQSPMRVIQYLETVIKSPRNVLMNIYIFSRWSIYTSGSSNTLIILSERDLPFGCGPQRQDHYPSAKHNYHHLHYQVAMKILTWLPYRVVCGVQYTEIPDSVLTFKF